MRIYNHLKKTSSPVRESRLSSRSSTPPKTPVQAVPDIKVPGAPDPHTQPAEYLRSIHAVRQRSRLVLQKAKQNELNHFEVDASKFQDTVDYVVSIIKVCLCIVDGKASMGENGKVVVVRVLLTFMVIA